MLKILHFSDAHIDMANYGRHDPASGLPLRVIDTLKSLDTIVDAAMAEEVDLVLFAGDAYKDRNPAPTFQREWGRRIMRLSRAGIPTLLLVGNHDLSPALGRAHALDPFDTLEVPHVRVVDRPVLLTPDHLEGLPLQVIALPWISRSGLIAHLGLGAVDPAQVFALIEARLQELVNSWLEACDPALPIVLTAHASVQGARYGAERAVMLGSDLVLSGALVRNPRLDYVALGHIHKAQELNPGAHPPVVYSGSIERMDFGEAGDEKFFIFAHVERGKTRVEWRKLEGIRPFIDRTLRLETQENVTGQVQAALPAPAQAEGAILRLSLDYPRDWETSIDEAAIRQLAAGAFEFHLVKRPQSENRIRLPENQAVGSLTPLELLDLYWRASHVEEDEREALSRLAASLIGQSPEDAVD
ncbi:MAG: exonuclease SbcCD subunit D [Anaerolineales bacterium]|nr:exonuclease SbcCD subunit D [Anaerolineales bacterium]